MSKIVTRPSEKVERVDRHQIVSLKIEGFNAGDKPTIELEYSDVDTGGTRLRSIRTSLSQADAATFLTANAAIVNSLVTAIFTKLIADGTIAGTVGDA